MAKSASKDEFLNVMSSIRKIVSDNAEMHEESSDKAVASQNSVAKLLLTADFRVSEPQIDEPDTVPLELGAPLESSNSDFAKGDSSALLQNLKEEIDQDRFKTSSLEHTIAELEDAIARQNIEWEPDGSGFDEGLEIKNKTPQPAQEWMDNAAKQPEITSEHENSKSDVNELPEESIDPINTLDSVIDEDALRDMISDIVRQELQGVLGERITRNVRKLVRREINLVLAAQDFD